jgi:hypothetical protein
MKLKKRENKSANKSNEKKVIFKSYERVTSIFSFLAMTLLVGFVYTSFSLLTGKSYLLGIDFKGLFLFRIDYLKESFSNGNGIPGWYSREFLGSPFWSNIQNFPLIPTRFIFYLMDTAHAYAVVVLVSALLTAVFTYLFLRKSGLNSISSAAAGWTFACSGFFASRIWAGHLSLIESFFSLPLLLWLAEEFLQRKQGDKRNYIFLIVISFSTALICLSGHPQLPFYAITTTIIYIIWKERSNRSYILLASMASGVIISLLIWYPFLKLVLRSTRILHLEKPENDIYFPYERLKAFIMPWADGWGGFAAGGPAKTFSGYPSRAFFWDTVCYIGIVPLLALLALSAYVFFKKIKLGRKSQFFAFIGFISLITALPFMKTFYEILPLTLFRSPSRQIYLTSFCIALGFGYSINFVMKKYAAKINKKIVFISILLILTVHLIDLGRHDRYFIGNILYGRGLPCQELHQYLSENLKDGRVAMDYTAFLEENRKYDDVGFFDSIVLASTYNSVLKVAGIDPKKNIEEFFSSTLPVDVLQKLCAKCLISLHERKDLIFVATIDEKINVYEVPDPLPRVSFLSEKGDNVTEATVEYKRISGDRMEIKVSAPQDGFVRIIEAYDIGWSATVDGIETSIEKLDGFMMKINIPKGEHTINLEYKTPGALTGMLLSLSGILLLVAVIIFGKKRNAI